MPKLIISDKTRQLRFEIVGNHTVSDLANLAALYYLGSWYLHDLQGTNQMAKIDATEGTDRNKDWPGRRDFDLNQVFESTQALLIEEHHFCGDMSHAFDAAFEADIEDVA